MLAHMRCGVPHSALDHKCKVLRPSSLMSSRKARDKENQHIIRALMSSAVGFRQPVLSSSRQSAASRKTVSKREMQLNVTSYCCNLNVPHKESSAASGVGWGKCGLLLLVLMCNG